MTIRFLFWLVENQALEFFELALDIDPVMALELLGYAILAAYRQMSKPS